MSDINSLVKQIYTFRFPRILFPKVTLVHILGAC